MHFLSKIDQFGVPIQLRTDNGNTNYTTKKGGIITMVIYTLCLLYAIQVIYNWRTGSIPPKVISTLTTTGESQFFVPEGDIQLNFEYLEQNIFSSKGNILTPLVFGYDIDSKETPIFSESTTIVLPNFTLVQPPENDEFQTSESGLFFALIRCNPIYLTEGQYCAEDSEINRFLSTYSEITKLQISLHQFNQKENLNTKINKQFFLTLESQYFLSTQINLKTTKQMQDTNMFVENYDETSYISNFEFNSQIVSQDFMKKHVNIDALTVLFITLDSLQTQTVIVYPKINEILASIGSIVSIILSLKIIAESLNFSCLNEELMNFIIQVRYPEFNDIEIEKDILGKIIKVKYKKKELELERFISKYNQAKLEAISYLQLSKILEILIKMQKLYRKLEDQDKGDDKEQVLNSLLKQIKEQVNTKQQEQSRNKIQPFQPEDIQKPYIHQSLQNSNIELEGESVSHIFK